MIRGIFTPNLVPFDERGRVHERELRRYIDWLIAKGVSGIYANGSTGEFPRLTKEERVRVVEVIVDQASGRVPVMAGAAEENPEEVLKVAAHYGKIGCAAISLVGPQYFKLSDDSVCAYFEDIVRRSPIDVLLYNIPQFTNGLSLDTVKHLCTLERVIGIKDSSRNLPQFLDLMHEVRPKRADFVFFTGTEEMLLPALFMGATGGTVATSGVVPETVMKLYRAFCSGDTELAKSLQFVLLPLIRLMASADFPEGFRLAVTARGFSMGRGRLPLGAQQQRKCDEIRTTLPSLIEPCLALATD
jgi:2-dehydro-3-deoxy-D-pentonate aldolase